MYDVVQHGHILISFQTFSRAWVYIVLELDCFAWVIGPDGYWNVNPGQHFIN